MNTRDSSRKISMYGVQYEKFKGKTDSNIQTLSISSSLSRMLIFISAGQRARGNTDVRTVILD